MTNLVNGAAVVCADGVCRLASAPMAQDAPQAEVGVRLIQGLLTPEQFLDFLSGTTSAADSLSGLSPFALAGLALLSGFLMNLTPCVLPMIPVHLAMIGRVFRRGLLYALGMAFAFGILGLFAALGGPAFGALQGNAGFNAIVALVFFVLALSMLGVFTIDLSRYRFRTGVFLMGGLNALLAGACVAPLLVSLLLVTADLFSQGQRFALVLPFLVGLGFAFPWPFLAVGFSFLPRSGAWMRWVNRFFAAILLLFAAYYGWRAFGPRPADETSVTPDTFAATFAADDGRPVLVDCWASWCGNCAAMEKGTLADPRVRRALERFRVIKLQAEDLSALQRLPGFSGVIGLPAYLIFNERK